MANQDQTTAPGAVLLSAGSVASTYPGYRLPIKSYKDECLVQISIGGQATVNLDGRVASSVPWVSGILSAARTASEIVPIAWTPQIRVVVTSVSAASVTVALHHGNVIQD